MVNILCVCSNRQSFENVFLVVKQFPSQFEIDFLDLKGIYHQYDLNKENVNTIDIQHKLNKPFYLMNELERLYVVVKIKKNIYFQENYDIIILGDLGIIEYSIVKKLKKSYNTKIFFIQDSILLYPENKNFKKLLRKVFYNFETRQNICDNIFVSGEATKLTLIADRVKSGIIINSGIPRFNYLFSNIESDNNNFSNNKVLFLTAAYKWHGYNNKEILQKNFIDSLDSIALKYPNIEINIRQHPRDYNNYSLKVTN